ncbi:MAG: ATP synthase F0 subunit C [Patescibacteria group bacterium]
MVSGSINGVFKNPKIKSQLLTYMILFLALIESAAIYGLIVSFQIISIDDV